MVKININDDITRELTSLCEFDEEVGLIIMDALWNMRTILDYDRLGQLDFVPKEKIEEIRRNYMILVNNLFSINHKEIKDKIKSQIVLKNIDIKTNWTNENIALVREVFL